MRRAAVLAALLATGCGGGSPSRPTPVTAPAGVTGWPAGTVVELVSGETGAEVAGNVTIAGIAVPAHTPLSAPAAAGATVDVVLPAFLSRQTSVRSGETRLSLWPDTEELPGDYTKAIVYTEDDGTVVPLRRLPSRTHTVAAQLSGELQADAAAADTLQQAVEGLNGALAGRGVAYLVGATADLTVPLKVDPSASDCTASDRTLGFTEIWLTSSNEITRAEITFCATPNARSVGIVAHELGHTFGLRHSSDAQDLMARYHRPGGAQAPTSREALTMALLLQRRPGTAWPDNDRDTQAAARRHVVIE